MSSGAEGLLDRVRAVVPLIAERAASAEAARQPDDDVIQALRDTGVFKAFVSKRYGGYELDLETYARSDRSVCTTADLVGLRARRTVKMAG